MQSDQPLQMDPIASEMYRTDFTLGVLDGITDPIIVYDSTWRARYENPAAARVFQRVGPHASMVGRVLWTEYPDLKGTAFEREMMRAMNTRTPTSFVERRTGRSVWTEARCYPLADGGIAVVWRDITEQRRAEHALEVLSVAGEILHASLDYEETINSLAQLVVPDLADWCSISLLESGKIRMVAAAHVNPDKLKLVRDLDAKYPSDPGGRTRTAEVIRTGQPDLIPEVTDAMLDQAIEDPEYRAMLKTLGFTSVITVPLAVRDRVLGAMSLVSMASESRRQFTEADVALAEELARRAAIAVDHAGLYAHAVESRTIAEEANAAKMAFLARMSHELRTPLNAIGGYTDLLSLGIRGPVTDEQRSDLDRIRRSQQHLLALINDVLNYARLEAGRLEYDIKRLSLPEALLAIEPLFALHIQEKRLRYQLREADTAVFVQADAERLQQIMVNLISNAIKFVPPEGEIEVSARTGGEWVEVIVRDTGPGIPIDKLESIFEPFVQLPRGGQIAEGTGLGLAISRDLARGMGGNLTVESSHEGSTFTLSLLRSE